MFIRVSTDRVNSQAPANFINIFRLFMCLVSTRPKLPVNCQHSLTQPHPRLKVLSLPVSVPQKLSNKTLTIFNSPEQKRYTRYYKH